MAGDRYNYYLKMILSAKISEYSTISESIGNDPLLQEKEMEELDSLIRRYLASQNSKYKLRVINSRTGLDEAPPKGVEDDFGGLAVFKGREVLYGISWYVYEPHQDFNFLGFTKWYYNERIAAVLNESLIDVIPGRFQNYFDNPPWVLGSIHAPGTKFVPLTELVENAINMGHIQSWDSLVSRGIPPDYIKAMRATDLKFTSDRSRHS